MMIKRWMENSPEDVSEIMQGVSDFVEAVMFVHPLYPPPKWALVCSGFMVYWWCYFMVYVS